MKTLIISDTHLTNKFDPAKYKYLEEVMTSADNIIINGDLWDHDLCTFDEFINSEWQALFPIMKQRKAIYILGDHDAAQWSDDRVNLFSGQQLDSYSLTVGKSILHIEHGHHTAPDLNILHTWTKKYKWFNKLMRILIPISTSILGIWHYRLFYTKMNNQMKAWAHKNLPQNGILVAGHSHLPEYSPKQQFINIGANIDIMQGYLMIEGENFKLVKK